MITTALVYLLRTTLVLIATHVTGFVARKHPATRLTIYRLGIAATVGVVLVSPSLQSQPHPIVPIAWAPSSVASQSMPISTSSKQAIKTPAEAAPSATIPATAYRAVGNTTSLDPDDVVLPIWMLGVFVLTGLLAAGYIAISRIRRSCVQVRDESLVGFVEAVSLCARRRVPLVLDGDSVRSPFVAGVFRPTIYLPKNWHSKVDSETLQAVLRHEMAHIAGGDLVWGLIYRLVRIVLWPQPLLWLLGRPIMEASEDLCDRHVLVSGVSEVRYAQCLLDLRRSTRPCPALGIGAVSKRTPLSKRIEAILHAPRKLGVQMSRPAAFAIGIVAMSTVAVSAVLIAKPSQATQADPFANWVKSPYPAKIRLVSEDGTSVADAKAWLKVSGNKSSATYPMVVVNGVVTIDSIHAFDRKDSAGTLVVKAKGFGLGFTSVWPVAKRINEIRLPSPVRLKGRLIEPGGAPAVNVHVITKLLVRMHQNPTFISYVFLDPDMGIGLDARTDRKGEFSMDGFPTGVNARLDVADDRFAQIATEDVKVGAARVTQAKDIQLEPAATLAGRITRNGIPVPGLHVEAQPTNDELHGSGASGDGTTDGSGRYTLKRLPAGTYNVAVEMQGRDETTTAYEKVKVRAGQMLTGMDFALIPGAIIEGRVSDEGGKPVANVAVGIYGPAHPESSAWVQMATTDKNGRYKAHVPAGRQRVYVMDGSYAQDPKYVMVKDATATTVDLKAKPRARPETDMHSQAKAEMLRGPSVTQFPNGTEIRLLHMATWSKANGYSAWDLAGNPVKVTRPSDEIRYLKNNVLGSPSARGRWVSAVYEICDPHPDPEMQTDASLGFPNATSSSTSALAYKDGFGRRADSWLVPYGTNISDLKLRVGSGLEPWAEEKVGGNGKLSPRMSSALDHDWASKHTYMENGKRVAQTIVAWQQPSDSGSKDMSYVTSAIWSDGLSNNAVFCESLDRRMVAAFLPRPGQSIVAIRVKRRVIWERSLRNVALAPTL